MRILQVTSTYYPELQFGGPPQKIHTLSRKLVERGHTVQVVTLHSGRPLAHGHVPVDGIDVQYVPWVGKRNWQLPLGFGTLRAAVQWAEVVHCYGLYNLLCPAAAFLARQIKRPFLLEPLGMYVPRLSNVRAKVLYHRIFTARMIAWAARVIVTSPWEAEQMAGLVDNAQLVLRPNPIDLTLFQKMPEGATFRASHHIEPDEQVILFVGRISPVKNLEQLVLAYHQAALGRSRLVLVGPMLEPDYAARLRSLIGNLNLGDRVLLLGPLYDQDKLAALAAANLFVLPSLSESFGNAAAEAVAAGIPVLLTQTCGIAPLIHGRAGLAVPQTTDALAAGLHLMVEDVEQCARLTQRRAEALHELSEQDPLQQTELLYQAISREINGE